MGVNTSLRSVDAKQIRLATVALFVLSPAVTFLILRSLLARSVLQDEAYTYCFVTAPWRQFLGILPKLDIGISFYYVVLRWWSAIFGDTQFSLRLFSTAFALASVLALYRLTAQLFSRKVALIASSLLLLNSFWFQQGQTARVYSLATFIALLATIAFVEFLRSTPGSRWPTVYVIAMLTLTFAQFAMALTLFVGHIATISIIEGRKRKLQSALPAVSVIFAIIACGAYTIHTVGSTLIGPTENVGAVSIAQQASSLLGRKYALIVLGLILLTSLYSAIRRRQGNVLAVVLWTAIPILIISALATYDSEALGARHMMSALCPFLIGAAVGIAEMSNVATFAIALGAAIIAESCGLITYLGESSNEFETKVTLLANSVHAGDTVVFSPPYLAVRAYAALRYANLSLPKGLHTIPGPLSDAWFIVDQRMPEPHLKHSAKPSSGTLWLFAGMGEDGTTDPCEVRSQITETSIQASISTICVHLAERKRGRTLRGDDQHDLAEGILRGDSPQ